MVRDRMERIGRYTFVITKTLLQTSHSTHPLVPLPPFPLLPSQLLDTNRSSSLMNQQNILPLRLEDERSFKPNQLRR